MFKYSVKFVRDGKWVSTTVEAGPNYEGVAAAVKALGGDPETITSVWAL